LVLLGIVETDVCVTKMMARSTRPVK
jgi:hypothetical protein